MKKFFVIALAIIFVAPFVADMAIAGDLSTSGSMRVRAWSIDDGSKKVEEYWDQRFRLGATFSAAEGVSAHLRLDFNENAWGNQDWSGSRSVGDNELQVDRAYLQVDQERYKVKAGQLYAGLGGISAYDNNQYGVLVDIKDLGPVTLTLGFLKVDEDQTTPTVGDSTVPAPQRSPVVDNDLTDEKGYEDLDHWIANVAFATGAFSLNVFTALQMDDTDKEDEKTMFGANVKTSIANIALFAEVDVFSGDRSADAEFPAVTNTDYIGTQLYVNAERKFGDKITGGVDLVYAEGTDDPTETQLTQLGDNFSDWTLMDRGPFQADITDFDDMDPSGNNGGSMGGGVYVDFAAIEKLLIQASIFSYSMPEDGTNLANIVDSVLGFNIGLSYDLAKNATLAAQYNTYEYDDALDTDAVDTIVARLQVKF